VWLQIKLASRNIFRNKRRTFIAGTAIGIGLAALIFTDALVIGMENNMIASATESFMGEGQIHREGFRQSYDVEETIIGPDEIMQHLRQEPMVAHYTARTLSFAMMTSPANVSSVTMVGIDPETERHLSQIDEAMIKGDYFSGDNVRDIVIGDKLAEILEADIGSRVVLTVAQAHTGDLAQEMFRISGIYHFNIREMDLGMAFIRLPKAQQMLNLDHGVHEIAIMFKNESFGRNPDNPFWARYSQNGNEAVPWTVLMPMLAKSIEVSQFATFLVGIILFGVVALGIVNTLFMSMHERMFEFGVLRAVGTRAMAMARLIVIEAGTLAALSIVLGAIMGLIVTAIVMHTGINYTGIEFAGVTFRKLLYPVLTVKQFIVYPAAVFIFTLLVALYPAAYAARLSPSKAMRRSF
jgi:ABC-type lipoprotein release transport system permease subunit